jgi:hypothetical protein
MALPLAILTAGVSISGAPSAVGQSSPGLARTRKHANGERSKTYYLLWIPDIHEVVIVLLLGDDRTIWFASEGRCSLA